MSKIFGIISKEFDQYAIEKIFNKMRDHFYYSDSMVHHVWHSDQICLGRLNNGSLNTEKQPLSRKNKYLVFNGHLLDYQLQKKQMIDSGVNFEFQENDAEYLLNYLYENGSNNLDKLNGIFSSALWDTNKKQLILINDRYGMKPLYYAYSQTKQTFIFSSEVKPIILSGIIDKKVDWHAWNVFLRLDYMISDYTFFKNISRLPPASILTINFSKGINISKYWTIDNIEIDYTLTVEKISNKAYQLFKNSISKYLKKVNNKIWIGLSGGHDSRWIASELKSQNANFKAFTTRKFNPYIDDIMIAKEVSKCLNIDHQIIDLPKDYLNKYNYQKNKIHDYESHDLDANFLRPMFEKIPKGYKFSFTGTGDCIVNGRYLDESFLELLQNQNYRLISKKLLRKRGLGYLRSISNYILKSNNLKSQMIENKAIDLIEAELKKYKDYPDPISAFYFFNRIRREISLSDSAIFIGKSETFSPYLENDFFDFLMSVPPAIKLDKQILNKVFNDFYPNMSIIPFADLMNDKESEKYYNNNIDIEKQLKLYCSKTLNQLTKNKKSFLSKKIIFLIHLLFIIEYSTPLFTKVVNTLVKRNIRKYQFPRFFTIYAVVNMISLLDQWTKEYEITFE